MTFAVSCCVCIASIVITAEARPAKAFSRSRTAGISLLFTSTATCPRTAPIPCARAATRCGAFPSLPFAPRTALPSIAITSRPRPAPPGPEPRTEGPVQDVRADQGERAPVGGLLRRAAARAERGKHVRAGIGGPLPDRGERPRPRDHRRDPDGQEPGQRMPAAPPLTRVRDLGQEIEQVPDAGSIRYRGRCHERAGVPRAVDGERRELPSFRPGPARLPQTRRAHQPQ